MMDSSRGTLTMEKGFSKEESNEKEKNKTRSLERVFPINALLILSLLRLHRLDKHRRMCHKRHSCQG